LHCEGRVLARTDLNFGRRHGEEFEDAMFLAVQDDPLEQPPRGANASNGDFNTKTSPISQQNSHCNFLGQTLCNFAANLITILSIQARRFDAYQS
jgi:hypothetical protein